MLVRHAPTAATGHAFPLDEPISPEAGIEAAQLAERLPPGCVVLCSPALRCRQTADAAGLQPVLEPLLAECDFGSWGGRSMADVSADAAERWMADPESSPHGGESLSAFAARVSGWLDEQATAAVRLVAITHAGVIRAAIVHALAAPPRAFWALEASPLRITELVAFDGRWTVSRVNCAA
jgi:broad specificity phosphatase PhoE